VTASGRRSKQIDFEFRAVIERPISDVFDFFRDMDQHPRSLHSVVPVYDRVTDGPVSVGTRYREVIRFLPFVTGVMMSEITCFEPERRLGLRFSGLGMDGELTYNLQAAGWGTLVVQRQSLRPRGLLALLNPLIETAFSRVAGQRLRDIKSLLDTDSASTKQE
jgi:hypothetical protein